MTGKEDPIVYRSAGFCPICRTETEFAAVQLWFRDHLLCSGCRSVPRDRALAWVLERELPHWRSLAIHESSPMPRGISLKLARECPGYIASHYFPDQPPGSVVSGFRNETLEQSTFADESLDLVVSLDVMEHVNEPADVFRDVRRTLRRGGIYLFTVPTYKEKIVSERRARYHADRIEFLAPPEYHGNPVDDRGSLVTFHYGYDLPELIHHWSGLQTEVFRFHDHRHGIIGAFTEVYLSRK